MKHGIFKSVLFLMASALLMSGCTVSYKLNQSSIDYNTIKTISIETFANRAAYQWAPMAPMFNTSLSDKYENQTKLRQVRRDGDLALSGEITSYDQTNKSISADGYSSMVQLRMTVKVKFTNTKKHEDDFDRTFSASREYDSSQQLTAVQEELVQQMIDDIVDQVFNATVAKW
ncbi:MAG: LPS assembly lipoprotein LptE [Bacteroidaceae bacterium]|nr:LPS assembly lipoprotein LptE [Bacteroidaceae bacterium]